MWFVVELVRPMPTENGALLALAAFLWAMLMLGIGQLFPRAPDPVGSADGLRQRFLARCRWIVFWALAIVALGVTGLVVLITLRAIGLSLDS